MLSSMGKRFSVVVAALLVAGCATMTSRYSASVDNNEILKSYGGKQVKVVSLNQTAVYDSSCRLVSSIMPAGGLSIAEFIAKAFNDEFKLAGVYSEAGGKVTGDVTRVSFSSSVGITNGFWEFEITLNLPNGKILPVASKHTFKSGFEGVTACNATSEALSPAVQELIHKVISHPDFAASL